MTLRDLALRARALLRPSRVEQELAEELAFHLEHETRKLIEEGTPPAEARRRAQARFGSTTLAADRCRDERGTAVIDNAVRYSPPGRPVRVEAAAVGGHVVVRVVDRGPGIPREDRERVSQPFQRLGDHPGGIGVGLGLAVAHGFLTAMGATIEIDDTPGGGTTVVVSVPTAPEPG